MNTVSISALNFYLLCLHCFLNCKKERKKNLFGFGSLHKEFLHFNLAMNASIPSWYFFHLNSVLCVFAPVMQSFIALSQCFSAVLKKQNRWQQVSQLVAMATESPGISISPTFFFFFLRAAKCLWPSGERGEKCAADKRQSNQQGGCVCVCVCVLCLDGRKKH